MKVKFDFEKIIVLIRKYILPALCILIIVFGTYKIMFTNLEINISKIDIVVNDSETNWYNGDWVSNLNIEVVNNSFTNLITEYSFDNGVTWQESNSYTATTSGKIVILLKNKEGTVSKSIQYNVIRVDSTKPEIEVSLPETIQIGSNINLKNYVTATDEESGISGNVQIDPSVINTSKEGQYTIKFEVSDKVGNVATKTVSVIVE